MSALIVVNFVLFLVSVTGNTTAVDVTVCFDVELTLVCDVGEVVTAEEILSGFSEHGDVCSYNETDCTG